MSNLRQITTALCLPAPDIEALAQGRVITCLSRGYIHINYVFALYPSSILPSFLPPEKHYRLNFLSVANEVLKNFNYQQTFAKVWATCEQCKALSNISSLEKLSGLTIWESEALKEILVQHPNTFLTYLRIYPLQLEMPTRPVITGDFISLLSPQFVSNASPILSDRIFSQRKQQLEELKPPSYPELEDLLSAVALLANNDLVAKKLEQDIKVFLGWAEVLSNGGVPQDLAWTETIVALGNRSKELDQGKSNYQAGTDFEIIARQSLEFLGFKIDQAYRGGAGGLDLFCSEPFPLTGECKAGKKIPSGTTEELLKLGGMHLGVGRFLASAKLIIGPGIPTSDVLKAAIEWKVSIINPMSLEKLVKLKAKYPGSIDLIALKKYLEPGQIDHKIDEYVEKVLKDIKLRSCMVGLVKRHLENTSDEDVGVDTLYGAYSQLNSTQTLKREKMHEILVELSSPITGFLGRVEGESWQSDRFYFLRDLLVD